MAKESKLEKQKTTCFKCQKFGPIAVVMHGHPLCERCYTMTQVESKRRKR